MVRNSCKRFPLIKGKSGRLHFKSIGGHFRNIALTFAVILGVFGISPAGAQILCNEPLKPFCLEQVGDLRPGGQKRCVSDIREYVVKMEEYIQCSRRKLQESIETKEAAEERLEELTAQLPE